MTTEERLRIAQDCIVAMIQHDGHLASGDYLTMEHHNSAVGHIKAMQDAVFAMTADPEGASPPPPATASERHREIAKQVFVKLCTWDVISGAAEWFIVSEIAAALARVADEEREACARIAENHESPFGQTHPDEMFRSRLQGVVLQALLGCPRGDGDDTQPERFVAEAVWTFLQTGRTRMDEFVSDTLGALCASQEIRQRAAAPA